jgi:hypothetical protein
MHSEIAWFLSVKIVKWGYMGQNLVSNKISHMIRRGDKLSLQNKDFVMKRPKLLSLLTF